MKVSIKLGVPVFLYVGRSVNLEHVQDQMFALVTKATKKNLNLSEYHLIRMF